MISHLQCYHFHLERFSFFSWLFHDLFTFSLLELFILFSHTSCCIMMNEKKGKKNTSNFFFVGILSPYNFLNKPYDHIFILIKKIIVYRFTLILGLNSILCRGLKPHTNYWTDQSQLTQNHYHYCPKQSAYRLSRSVWILNRVCNWAIFCIKEV